MASLPEAEDYQIAIICALRIEADAIQAVYDEIYDSRNITWRKAPDDRSAYTLGRIGRHNVVLAHMPGIGKVNASNTARDIRATFPNISRGLTFVAGVCGGAPQTTDGTSIYLGDIIISTEIQQADFGREHPSGFIVKKHSEGNLGPAPLEVKALLHQLSSRAAREKLLASTESYSSELQSLLDIQQPHASSDRLFPPDYIHKHQNATTQHCQTCYADDNAICDYANGASCTQLGCESANSRIRMSRQNSTRLSIHFGPVCSTDMVKRSGVSRDNYTKQYNALGFEMEGAGVWSTLPTLVVKAVCDYADSHKNKRWQDCAAVNAAACCKAIIEELIPLALASSNAKAIGELFLARTLVDIEEQQSVKRERWLKTLEFPQLDSRLHGIKYAQHGTCDWIFDSNEFKAWLDPQILDEHHGVLWIKGKPGSGKSVLMKHIYYADRFFSNYQRVAFFFHARGTDLEQTLNGMLRAILFKLLSHDSNLLDRFIEQYPERYGQSIEQQVWSNAEIQDFLFRCVRKSWLSNTLLLIDALDECDLSDARELTSFCEDIALEAIQSKVGLRICFSIRHFPNISVHHCRQLIIDTHDEHYADIEKYTIRKLFAKELVGEILAKSQHIFLWVVLVVQILNNYHDTGSDVLTMRRVLNQIPMGLKAVFDLLLVGDTGVSEETMFMLYLVLYSQPMPPRILCTLATIASDCEWRQFLPSSTMSEESLRLSIISRSRGLLEFTNSSRPPRQRASTIGHVMNKNLYLEADITDTYAHQIQAVQFIHESVAEYIREGRNLAITSLSAQAHDSIAWHMKIAEVYLEILSCDVDTKKTFSSSAQLFHAKAIREVYDHASQNIKLHIPQISTSDHHLRLYSDWLNTTSSSRASDALESILSEVVASWTPPLVDTNMVELKMRCSKLAALFKGVMGNRRDIVISLQPKANSWSVVNSGHDLVTALEREDWELFEAYGQV